MSTTKNQDQDSNPLICKVEVAFMDDIASMVPVDVHQVRITMKDAKVFNPIYGTPSSFNLNEVSETTRAGLIFNQKLSLYYPGMKDIVHPDLIQLEKKPVVVKITYQNGLVQVIGSITEPARIFLSLASNDATGHSILVACNSINRARFLTT